MALVVYDRVQETTATTGTGTITLGGAVAGYQSFAVVGNGNTTFYCIVNGSAWEVGIGTYTSSGTTLARTTVLSNSNGNTSPINLSGASNVFVTYPASKSVNEDASGNVNILTYVPNTTTTLGTLNVGDGTYNVSLSGQIASFAGADTVVNGINVQNTSNSNTAYTAIQIGADNFNAGYYLQLGTNSSTYDYAAAGYPNSSINQPNSHYILANKSDLGIATWDADDIHFLQNASVATTDSMTLYASGGVSLGGNPDPGLGTLYANNVYLGFTTITAAAGTTVLTNASLAWQNVVGTTTQTIQMPVATTLYKGFAFTVTNSSTGIVTITDNASTTLDTLVTGGSAIMVLTANATSAGTWAVYSYIPSTYNFSTSTANFGAATITNALWNGTTIASGYGGTGLTTFSAANNALYSTSASALAAGTLPVAAGGTGKTTNTLNGVVYGNGTSALGVTAAGTTGQVLQANTGGAPTWATTYAGTVTSVAQSFTGGLISVAGSPITTSGTLALTVAGTSGGIPYFSSASTWASSAALTQYGVVYGGGAGASPVATAAGTTGQVLIATTSGAPSWGSVPTTAAVTSLNFGTTGLTPASATTGAITVAGTLNVANGGTGLTTLSAGLVPYGNGTGALSSIAGLNFSSPTNAPANMLYSTGGMSVGTGTVAYPTQATGIGYESKGPTSNGRFMVQDGQGRLNQYWNAYTDAGGVKYIITGEASARYLMSVNSTTGGVHAWYGAPSGTAGTALSWTQMGQMTSGTGGSVWFSPRGTSSDFYIGITGGVSVGNTTDAGASNLSVTGSVTAANHIGAGTGLTGTASGLSIGGNAGTVTNGVYTTNIGTYAVKRSGQTGGNLNFNSTTATTNSQVIGFEGAPTNGPSGVTYSTLLVMQERSDTSSQLVVDYNTGRLYTRGIYLTTPSYSPWRTQIDDGNYNSYSPTLTGTGASGTWGISVTGSATGLTSSNYITSAGSSGNWNTDFQNTTANTKRYAGDIAGGTNNPGGTWWFQEDYRHSNGTNYWGTQVAWGWEDNANKLATRNVSGGSYGAWVYYVNSANVATYALPATGGTVSGSITATGGFYATSAAPFHLNATTVSANFTIPTDYNASSAGPITINTGVTVTVSTGSTWVVV